MAILVFDDPPDVFEEFFLFIVVQCVLTVFG
jgi:hypothetical protein